MSVPLIGGDRTVSGLSGDPPGYETEVAGGIHADGWASSTRSSRRLSKVAEEMDEAEYSEQDLSFLTGRAAVLTSN